MNDSDTAERIGLYTAGRVSAQLPGLLFREQRSGDTGLNAHLEITEDFPKAGKTIGLQVRSDENAHLEHGAEGYVCRGEMSHLVYWLQHAIPVIVMMHERKTGQILWEFVSAENIEIEGQEWELVVPCNQIYSAESVAAITALPSYSPYLSRLALDRPWMELIEGGKIVLLEAEEWINQPAARGTLRLCVCGADGAKESIYDWVFRTEADMPYVFRLPALFPWARLSVDEEFYRSRGASAAVSSEEGDGAEAAFIRPWSVEAGEIARFLLRLSLNELGKSFLTAERFLRRGEFPYPPPAGAAEGRIGEIYENGLKYTLYKKA
ncbi:MAG: DUF4365 domain-containing protein [Synergistaceae bacterium]|nr:DUF4365 domain-containing protein [Synergistaceae bacterium]